MTDKKPTDNEIRKALEYWKEFDKEIDDMLRGRFQGDKMLLEQKEVVKITLELFDLINRQKEEIESIRRKALLEAASKFAGHSNYHGDTILCKLICMAEGKEVGNARPLDMEQIKAEAYKEFVERLKKEMVYEHFFETEVVVLDKIKLDNLLKEMVGAEE